MKDRYIAFDAEAPDCAGNHMSAIGAAVVADGGIAEESYSQVAPNSESGAAESICARYGSVVKGTFLDRPNRFVAHVLISGGTETVHVKNTGRCRELLLPGAEVWLEWSDSPSRKTRYDLIAVRKKSGLLVNLDSQAPNRIVREWLDDQDFSKIIPEYNYGSSRIDFYMEKGAKRYLLEVKGCTLEIGGIGYFPDAPTERGVKHLRELAHAAGEGYHAAVAFVIQMDGVTEVRPNTDTHAAFGTALQEAREAGVELLFLQCHVEPDSLTVRGMTRSQQGHTMVGVDSNEIK